MNTVSDAGDTRRLVAYAAGLSALWAVLAFLRPGATYHLAPLIVAALPPAAGRFESRSGSPADTVRLALLGMGLALGTTMLLSTIGRLNGPTLLPFGGAAAEAVVFSVGGAFGGLLVGGFVRSGHSA